MKKLYKTLCCTLLCATTLTATANDSYYLMHGDQLIPLQQSDIEIQKEVLNITQTKDYDFLVDVNYTFYNPGEEKNLLVGFEARAPGNYYIIFDETPKKGKTHPALKDFSVVLNGVELPYQTAVVTDEVSLDPPIFDAHNMPIKSHLKATNGKVLGISQEQIAKLDYDYGEGFSYAYYFKTTFKPGKNILRHQYRFDYGGTSIYTYEMGYLLTPANRWANKQIDDFTLNIRLKSLDGVLIQRSFFNDDSHWSSDGQFSATPYVDSYPKVMQFNGDGKVLTFHKKDFHPQGELYLYKYGDMNYTNLTPDLGYCFVDLSYYSKSLFETCKNATAFELKVLRNLPFAKRGYVFRDKAVQKYYQDTQKWYKPNPAYQADMGALTADEVKWVNYWKNH